MSETIVERQARIIESHQQQIKDGAEMIAKLKADLAASESRELKAVEALDHINMHAFEVGSNTLTPTVEFIAAMAILSADPHQNIQRDREGK